MCSIGTEGQEQGVSQREQRGQSPVIGETELGVGLECGDVGKGVGGWWKPLQRGSWGRTSWDVVSLLGLGSLS